MRRNWEEEDGSRKSEPQALEHNDNVRKYLMKFHVDYKMTATLRSVENKVYRVQQKEENTNLR
jgi:hypothetical protein